MRISPLRPSCTTLSPLKRSLAGTSGPLPGGLPRGWARDEGVGARWGGEEGTAALPPGADGGCRRSASGIAVQNPPIEGEHPPPAMKISNLPLRQGAFRVRPRGVVSRGYGRVQRESFRPSRLRRAGYAWVLQAIPCASRLRRPQHGGNRNPPDPLWGKYATTAKYRISTKPRGRGQSPQEKQSTSSAQRQGRGPGADEECAARRAENIGIELKDIQKSTVFGFGRWQCFLIP